MVHDHLWEGIGLSTEILCLKCLEARLGRSLTVDDFVVGLPINDFIFDTIAILGIHPDLCVEHMKARREHLRIMKLRYPDYFASFNFHEN
jgi:hypothetical protein